jgi:hypothetical protein
MNFCSLLPELYVIMYVCSLRVLTYDCTFAHMITPFLNHILFLSWSEFILVHSHPFGSHFCSYVQMDHLGSASADVEAWTLMDCLGENGFPALLWDTLKDFVYTAYPKYLTR